MPRLRTYRVFISHCWEYGDDYDTLVSWLDDEWLFRWKNISVAEGSAMRQDKSLERRLRKRLGSADILLVIVGMEIPHRDWIQWELKWARIRGVPIVGVRPNGSARIPVVVQKIECPIVGWRRGSVSAAIMEHARDQR